MPSIVSFIITYQSDLAVLAQLIAALHQQGICVLVVDNGSAENIANWNEQLKPRARRIFALGDQPRHCPCTQQRDRLGQPQGARYVLLVDQDSIPAPGMVAMLLATYVGCDVLAQPRGLSFRWIT